MPSTLRARVRNGRLTLDEPSDLPEGTEVELFVLDAADGAGEDELDDDDRARLHAAIAASRREMQQGLGVPAAEVLDELRRQRG